MTSTAGNPPSATGATDGYTLYAQEASLPEDKAMIEQVALQQYAIVMNYFAQERRAYVGRTNLFLLANVGMAGFVSTALARISPSDGLVSLVQPVTISLAGLFVTWLWSRAIELGDFWLEHWLKVLKKLESAAFGEMNLFRGVGDSEEEHYGAKKIGRAALGLFASLWVIALAYSTIILALKLR